MVRSAKVSASSSAFEVAVACAAGAGSACPIISIGLAASQTSGKAGMLERRDGSLQRCQKLSRATPDYWGIAPSALRLRLQKGTRLPPGKDFVLTRCLSPAL